jgi:hypothetical protein
MEFFIEFFSNPSAIFDSITVFGVYKRELLSELLKERVRDPT